MLCLLHTETHKHHDQLHYVVLPNIANSSLCSALTDMFTHNPDLNSQIAFGYWEASKYVLLVAYEVRQTLANSRRTLVSFHFMHSSVVAQLIVLIRR